LVDVPQVKINFFYKCVSKCNKYTRVSAS